MRAARALASSAAAAPNAAVSGFRLWPEFVTEAEHDEQLAESPLVCVLDARLRKRRYERDHWDAVIVNYREAEAPDALFAAGAAGALRRWRALVATELGCEAFLPLHCIDLDGDGVITPHVDSVKFSGGVVSGLSLRSKSTLVLQRAHDDGTVVAGATSHACELAPRSMYTLSGDARFRYAHSVVGVTQRRLSLILRDEMQGTPGDVGT
ncbi:hypothetical protein M885DRAFT_567298 [Pelagophyceae sp. CCMP2097]|nr:hypothetical protein M885DRAFT_567298 [Pelagophyceae sp. CCMP2097]